MIKDILKRIEERLDAVGLSAAAASVQAGLSKDAIRNIQRAVESEREGISTATLEKLAPVLETTSGWLVDGDIDRQSTDDFERATSARIAALKIAGEVAAGVWREVDIETAQDFEVMPAIVDPQFPKRAQFLLIVRGSSLNKIAADGDYLLCVSLIDSGVDVESGDLVVVERSKDEGGLIETTAKRIHRRDGYYELRPESNDPQFQKPIVIPEKPDSEFEMVRIVAKVILISKKP